MVSDRMSKYDQVFIFLSYSRKDETKIIVIENTLLKMNISRKKIFRDIPSIVLGDDWLDKIIEAIKEANVCFFLWTNNIEDSNIIKSERESAESLMRRIEFKNKGLFKGKNPQPYYIIDIVADNLNETLKLRLKTYGTKQQIRFESAVDFPNNVIQRFKKEVTPLLERIQEEENQYRKTKEDSLDKADQPSTKSLEKLRGIRELIRKIVETGQSFEAQFKYQEALSIYQRARKEARQNPEILLDIEQLQLDTLIASVFLQTGQAYEAKELYEEILEQRKELLKKELYIKLSLMHNLSEAYRALGKYPKTQQLLEKVLQCKEDQLGVEDHPSVLVTMQNLAGIYQMRGNYTEARELFERVVNEAETVFGIQHPKTLIFKNNLAGAYQVLGEYEEAQRIYSEVLKKREILLKENHPSTLTTIHKFAGLRKVQGKYMEAQELYERALTGRKELLGDSHPDTLITMHNFAELYRLKGDYTRAEDFYKFVLEKNKERFGENHPDTLSTTFSLAQFFMIQEKYKEAEELLDKVLEKRVEILGENHPDTLITMNELAQAYRNLKELKKAQQLSEEVVRKAKEQFGENHKNTLAYMATLARIYYDQGNNALYEKIRKDILDQRMNLFENDHSSTLTTTMNQGAYKKKKNGIERIEKLLALKEKKEKRLGRTHPEVLECMQELADEYNTQEEYEKAEEIYKEMEDRMENRLKN